MKLVSKVQISAPLISSTWYFLYFDIQMGIATIAIHNIYRILHDYCNFEVHLL